MDRERLGRVLGKGAREAVRTAMEAVDAASAPAPATNTQPAGPRPPVVTVEQRSTRRTAPSMSSSPLAPALKTAAAGVTAPLRKASRALWYELTGSFFALFALSFSLGLWRARASVFSGIAQERHRFYAFCVLTMLFAYFAVSSFARAKRVSR